MIVVTLLTMLAQISPEHTLEQTLLQHGPIAASVAFVLGAVKVWKSQGVTNILTSYGLTKRIAWENLNPAQKTGVSIIMTIVTAIAHVLIGGNPWTVAFDALATFAGAQTVYTTSKQVSKAIVEKHYEPSVSRPSSLITKPPSGA